MKKFSPIVAVIALAAAVAVGVVVGRKWPAAPSPNAADTAKPASNAASAPAAAAARPKPDSVEIPAGGFDPQQVQVAHVSQRTVPVELSSPRQAGL